MMIDKVIRLYLSKLCSVTSFVFSLLTSDCIELKVKMQKEPFGLPWINISIYPLKHMAFVICGEMAEHGYGARLRLSL